MFFLSSIFFKKKKIEREGFLTNRFLTYLQSLEIISFLITFTYSNVYKKLTLIRDFLREKFLRITLRLLIKLKVLFYVLVQSGVMFHFKLTFPEFMGLIPLKNQLFCFKMLLNLKYTL